MLRFLIGFVITSLFLGVMTYFGYHEAWWNLPTFWVEILFFNLFMTVVVYYNLNKLKAGQPQAFTQFYLLSIVLKMIGGLTLISFIIWDDPAATIGNVTLFIVSYLILTFLEVFYLMSKPVR